MKYCLKGENDFIFSLEENIFKNRKVENIESFKNVDIKNTHNPYLLKNMEKATNILIKHLKNMSNIHIIVDSDADGVCSAGILYNYLSKIYNINKISWNVHSGKQHGIVIEELEGYEFDLLIVPDGGTNDIVYQQELIKKGKDIIILDHHIIESNILDNKSIAVVNSQDGNYPNPQLSGVGVVYKFIQALDVILNSDCSTLFVDLVAIGLISDMMDVRVLENRFYIQKGLNNLKNNFIKALIEKQSYSINNLNMNSIAFYITPLINAIFRVGTIEERKKLFQAFIDKDTMVLYKKRGNNKEGFVFLYEDMARECLNIKNRQKRDQDKYKEILKEQIIKYEMDKHNVLLVNADNLDRNFSGLIANSLAQEYSKPTLVLSEKKESEYSGSGRNFNQSPMLSFKNEIEKSGLCNYIAGHDNAFGVSFDKNKLKDLIIYFNSLDYNFKEKLYYVDFIMQEKDIDKKIIKQINSLQDYYGHGFEECLITIEKIKISNVYFNDKMTLMSFMGCNDIKYVKFFPKEKDKEILKNKIVECNIIGKVGISSYNNIVTYQFIIEEYEVLRELKKEEVKEEDDFIW